MLHLACAVPITNDHTPRRPIDDIIDHARSSSTVCPKTSPPPPPPSTPFPCSPYPHTPATSVHHLTPYNVGIVAAMGDSITAAFAACAHCIVEVVEECRGVSWSIGGVDDYSSSVTLPNILKQYNPSLTGFSTGSNIAKLPGKHAGLNVAVSGAVASDLVPQAEKLVQELKSQPDQWKVLTIFIGGNDLCAACKEGSDHSPETYARDIEAALDVLQAVPRLFINLVSTIDVTKLYPVKNFGCTTLHGIECSCGTSSDDTVRANVSATAEQYHLLTVALADKAKYRTRDDWTVVNQPFMINSNIPLLSDGTPDRSYLAPDCFHFARKTHNGAAVALWNNMFQPIGSKDLQWTLGESVDCPSHKQPYFATWKNSQP